MSEGDKLCYGIIQLHPNLTDINQYDSCKKEEEKKRKGNRNINRKEITMLSLLCVCYPNHAVQTEIYSPCVKRCCQRGGEARLSRRAHNPQSGFHFCKIAGGRKFKSTPRYYFFSNKKFVFSMPYLCNGFVRCLCALGVGMYNPLPILRSCGTRIFLVLISLYLHLSHW
jgi:putative hemolysin